MTALQLAVWHRQWTLHSECYDTLLLPQGGNSKAPAPEWGSSSYPCRSSEGTRTCCYPKGENHYWSMEKKACHFWNQPLACTFPFIVALRGQTAWTKWRTTPSFSELQSLAHQDKLCACCQAQWVLSSPQRCCTPCPPGYHKCSVHTMASWANRVLLSALMEAINLKKIVEISSSSQVLQASLCSGALPSFASLINPHPTDMTLLLKQSSGWQVKPATGCLPAGVSGGTEQGLLTQTWGQEGLWLQSIACSL